MGNFRALCHRELRHLGTHLRDMLILFIKTQEHVLSGSWCALMRYNSECN